MKQKFSPLSRDPVQTHVKAHRLRRISGRSKAGAPIAAAAQPPVNAPDVTGLETKARGSEPADSLMLYLREIGQVKLLTPSEEVSLARRIRRGDKQAREHMIKANLRLVVKIARDYEGLGVPLLDLISEGNIGLIKGVERFNPRKGAKLSTYASLWIKQQIRRALANQSKTIRLPAHVVERMAHVRRAEVKLRETLDREPTEEEISQEVNLPPRRIRQYREASRAPVPLDAPVGDDAAHRLSEIVPDLNAAQPFDGVARETDSELLREVLELLSPRERAILALRFGLNDGVEKTLEEVGKHFGLTRERIRQIQGLALGKLRQQMERLDIRTEQVSTLERLMSGQSVGEN
jgi:RNA polymerase primary sigma factor